MANKSKESRRRADPHQIANVSMSHLVGLVEAIDEMGGEAGAAEVAQDVEEDIDRLSPIVAATEFLGLVVVEKGRLRLTDLGRKVLHATVRGRKALFRDIVQDVPAFRHVVTMLRAAARPLPRQEVVNALAAHVGTFHAEPYFDALVFWGRYVELVRYDRETEQLSLRAPT